MGNIKKKRHRNGNYLLLNKNEINLHWVGAPYVTTVTGTNMLKG